MMRKLWLALLIPLLVAPALAQNLPASKLARKADDCAALTVPAGQTLICIDNDDAKVYRCTSTGTCVEAVPSSASGLASVSSMSVRYHDFDTDGDGTPDERLVGDYDGDGTLELADIQSALESLCDADSDGTTDRSADIDGDGTAEAYCGATLQLLPGTYGTGAAYDSINLSSGITGYTIRGSGINQTILKAEYSRATLCGGSGPGTNQGIINAAGDNVTISDMTLIGIGERGSGISDCDEDGTDEGGNDNAAQHGIQIGVSVADHAESVTVERVRILNSDRMGIHFNWTRDAVVRDVEVDGAGEHGFAAACPKGLQIVDSVFRKASNTSRSRGVEIFCSGTGGYAENILIANNRFEQNARHIWAFTGPDNSTISRLTILGNSLEATDYDDASLSNAGRAIEIGGSVSSTGAISQVLIARNQIAGSQAACISIAGVTNPLDSIQVTGNQLSDCESVRKGYVSGSGDGGSIRIQDTAGVTGLVIDGNDIEVDRGLAGIVVYGTQSVVKNNTLRGTLDASSDGRDSMIYVASTATDTQVVGNDIDLDGTSSGSIYGIYNSSADNTRIAGNHVKMDAQNNVVGILINFGSDDIIVEGNRLEGGDNGIATANGASTGVVIANNYAAPTNTSDAFSWAYNIGHGTNPVMIDNRCVGVGSSPCYRYNVAGFYRNNQTISGTPRTGSYFGALSYAGTAGSTSVIVDDLDEDGVIESTDICRSDAGVDHDCDGTADYADDETVTGAWDFKFLNNVRYASQYATGGDGTNGNEYTGWSAAFAVGVTVVLDGPSGTEYRWDGTDIPNSMRLVWQNAGIKLEVYNADGIGIANWAEDVVIEGNGGYIFHDHDDQYKTLYCNGTCYRTAVTNLEFQGNNDYDSTTNAIGLRLNGFQQGRFKNLRFRNYPGYSIATNLSSPRAIWNSVESVEITGVGASNTANYGTGIYIGEGGARNWFRDLYFKNIGTGIVINETNGSDNSFTNIAFEDTMGTCIKFQNGLNAHFRNIVVESGGGGYDTFLEIDPASGYDIQNNTIENVSLGEPNTAFISGYHPGITLRNIAFSDNITNSMWGSARGHGAHAYGIQNELQNGSLDGWTDSTTLRNWTTGVNSTWDDSGNAHGWAQSAAFAWDGTYSAKHSSTGTSGELIASADRIKVPDDEATYTFVLNILDDDATGASPAQVLLRAYDSGDTELDSTANPVVCADSADGDDTEYVATYGAWRIDSHYSTVDDTWVYFANSCTLPSGTAEIEIAVIVSTDSEVYIDGVGVYRNAAPVIPSPRFVTDSGDQEIHGALTAAGFTGDLTGNSDTATLATELDEDSDGSGDTRFALYWSEPNVPASASNSWMQFDESADTGSAIVFWPAPRAGRFLGLSCWANADTAGDSFSAQIANSGKSYPDLTATLSAGTSANTAAQDYTCTSNCDFAAGDKILVVYTTGGSWTSTTADAVCHVELSMDN